MRKRTSIIGMIGRTSILGTIAMTTDLAYGGNSGTTPDLSEPKETEEERKRKLAKAEIEIAINKANGLKEFFYGKNSVWALNRKNADRKARSKSFLED